MKKESLIADFSSPRKNITRGAKDPETTMEGCS